MQLGHEPERNPIGIHDKLTELFPKQGFSSKGNAGCFLASDLVLK